MCSRLCVALLLLSHLQRTTAVAEETAADDLVYGCTDEGTYSARQVLLAMHSRHAPCRCQVTSTSNLTLSRCLRSGSPLNIFTDSMDPDSPNNSHNLTSCSEQNGSIPMGVARLTITTNNTVDEAQPSFVIFFFQGENVSVTCTSEEPEHSTTDGVIPQTSQPPPSMPTTSSSDTAPVASSTSTTSSSDTPSTATVASSTSTTLSSDTPSTANKASGQPLNDTSDKTSEFRTTEPSTTTQSDHYIVLGVGIFLLVAAAIVLGCIVRTARHRSNPERLDSKGRHEKSRSKQRQGTLGSSNASLISNQHNYEEVSEDGLSGSEVKPLPDRKTSTVAPPPTAHIESPGQKAEQRSRHQSEARAGDGPGGDAETDGEYNVLDLCKSARLASAQQDGSAAPAPRANEEDCEYMEVGNDDSIYDNLDDDDRKRRQGQATSSKVKPACSPEERGRKQNGRGADVVFPNDPTARQRTMHEQSAPGTSRPAPACRTRYSKSYEDVTVEPSPPKQMSECQNHSRSLDLEKRNKVNYENHVINGLHGHRRSTSSKRHTASLHDLADPSVGDKPGVPTENLYANHSTRNTTGPAQPSGHTRHASSPPIGLERMPAAQTHPEDVVLRKKPHRPNIKSAIITSVAHPKGVTASFLQFQEAVRHSMEINPDELVMIDNVLYGTLPRNKSLPTTEL